MGDAMTETVPEIRGGFPEVRPVEDAPPELGQFVAAMHRLQDLTVSTRSGDRKVKEARASPGQPGDCANPATRPLIATDLAAALFA
jgi:hypothetical protein